VLQQLRAAVLIFPVLIRSCSREQAARPGGVAPAGRPVGGHLGPDPRAPEHPPLRRRPAAHARPRVHGGRPLRPAHRLPVEGPGRHEVLPRLHGPRPLPRVGEGRRLPKDVGGGPDGLRRLEGHRLVLAVDGRVHDQGAPRGGKGPGKTPRTGPRRGPSAACSSRRRASPSAWRWTGPTATT
jgi:hypothetical protein